MRHSLFLLVSHMLCSDQVFGSNLPNSHRSTRINLIRRNADLFVNDVRKRFSREVPPEEMVASLSAFKAMTQEVISMDLSDLQLEAVADVIDSQTFQGSFQDSMFALMIDLVSVAGINLMAYPGILGEPERQRHLNRFVQLAIVLGLPTEKFEKVFSQLKQLGPAQLEERVTTMQREIEEALRREIPMDPFYHPILEPFGLSSESRVVDRFRTVLFETWFPEMIARSFDEDDLLYINWKGNIEFLSQYRGLFDFEESVLQAVELLWSAMGMAICVPLSISIKSELTVILSAISDLCVVLKNEVNAIANMPGIVEKLIAVESVLLAHSTEPLDKMENPMVKLREKLQGICRATLELL